jgi:hypothetical protein
MVCPRHALAFGPARETDGCEESTLAVAQSSQIALWRQILRSNAIRHTVDALASRGDEGRGKLR